MSSIRDQLRDKIKARMALIRQGQQVTIAYSGKIHEFGTDVGAAVMPWRRGDVLPEDTPCIGFADQRADGTYEGADNTQQAHGLVVEIVGFVGSAAGQDLNDEQLAAMATGVLLDILAAIGSDPEWDGLAGAYTSLTGTEIELHPDGRALAAGIVNIRIDYYSPLWEV